MLNCSDQQLFFHPYLKFLFPKHGSTNGFCRESSCQQRVLLIDDYCFTVSLSIYVNLFASVVERFSGLLLIITSYYFP